VLSATGARVRIDFTDRDGQLPADSARSNTRFLIGAVSTPNVVDIIDIIDIDRVAPGTVLIDDSQPNCWSRAHRGAVPSQQHQSAASRTRRLAQRGGSLPPQRRLVLTRG
jgi:hypothetical protein